MKKGTKQGLKEREKVKKNVTGKAGRMDGWDINAMIRSLKGGREAGRGNRANHLKKRTDGGRKGGRKKEGRKEEEGTDR